MTYNMRNSALRGLMKKSPMQHTRSRKVEIPNRGGPKKYAYAPVAHEHTLDDGSVITNVGNTHKTRVIKGGKPTKVKLDDNLKPS